MRANTLARAIKRPTLLQMKGKHRCIDSTRGGPMHMHA